MILQLKYPFNTVTNFPSAKCQEAEQEFNLIKEEFIRNPEAFKTEINPEVFRSLINGLFQAEGHIVPTFLIRIP
jgi:hypothetical protein